MLGDGEISPWLKGVANYLFMHHAIVIESNSHKMVIIDYTLEGIRRRHVSASQSTLWTEVRRPDSAVHCRQIMERAEAMAKPEHCQRFTYWIGGWNCEHFCEYCYLGNLYCPDNGSAQGTKYKKYVVEPLALR